MGMRVSGQRRPGYCCRCLARVQFGFVWMTTQSGASPNGTTNDAAAGGGGAVFCSFSTPNLSFWRLLPIPGRTTARPLPVFDRGMPLNRSNYYVTIGAYSIGPIWSRPP